MLREMLLSSNIDTLAYLKYIIGVLVEMFLSSNI